jgi:DNA invertase Pin-like site-specific DNA recombinase/ssDNA-binding Zn-finger/Zn-ribbon topoisomerase 1
MFALSGKDNNQIYNVGLYVRLSREDEGYSPESESIINQKEYLTRHVMEQGWNLIDIFVDDGFSGTNFDRPAFQRLLKAIEALQINLVITKDLSRLGRDYIDTGHYVERYFPQHNVRYIALNDGVDTFESNNSNNDMSPFKSVMNDFYARDISKKVRTAMNTKRRNGKFVGAFAPYGYLKSPSDRNKLMIDPETAPVVKRIFELYVSQGCGYANIAHSLNDEKIPSPGIYKASKHANYNNVKVQSGLWTMDTVKSIIGNPTYMGCMTQRKRTTVSYKVKKIKTIPKEFWLTIEDTHEPIVDKETFTTAQRLVALKSRGSTNKSKVVHLLGGLLYCKDCGSRMTYTRTQKGEWYCICSNYKRFKNCSRHSYHEQELLKYIIEDLRGIAAKEVNQEDLFKEVQQVAQSRPQRMTAEDKAVRDLEIIEKRLAEIKRAIKSLYDDKTRGILTEQDYLDLSQDYNKEREILALRVSKIGKPKDLQQEAAKDLLKVVRDLVEFNSISKLILAKLVNRVEVSEEKNLTIYYHFKSSK